MLEMEREEIMKEREYRVLQAIAEDETITQAGLASQLDIAVGSVNWYIKRFINIGYIKVTRMDRTRLHYHLTPEGMAALAKRTTRYFGDALQVYRRLRAQAKKTAEEMQTRGIAHIWLRGDGEMMDIMRLTCIEAGIQVDDQPGGWAVKHDGAGYILYPFQHDAIGEGNG